jgi:hypothetical protein
MPTADANKLRNDAFYENPGCFKDYYESYERNKDMYDDDGIITLENSNEKLNKYLEIQCWMDMIEKNPDDQNLQYAIEMKIAGNLENYVFLNVFQPSFYKQFRDFVENNEATAENYIETVLITDI